MDFSYTFVERVNNKILHKLIWTFVIHFVEPAAEGHVMDKWEKYEKQVRNEMMRSGPVKVDISVYSHFLS